MFSADPRPELGESAALQWTRTELCRLLRDLYRARGEQVRVGTDLAFYYDPGDRLARVTPDLYVIPGMSYDEQLRCYKVWEREGRVPVLAVHLVDKPLQPEDGLMMHFFRLGLLDVVLYDPLWYLQPAGAPAGRRLLCHYQRGEQKLELRRQDHPSRVHLKRHGLWLVHRGGADLRVYTDPGVPEGPQAGTDPPFPSEDMCWPTVEERS